MEESKKDKISLLITELEAIICRLEKEIAIKKEERDNNRKLCEEYKSSVDDIKENLQKVTRYLEKLKQSQGKNKLILIIKKILDSIDSPFVSSTIFVIFITIFLPELHLYFVPIMIGLIIVTLLDKKKHRKIEELRRIPQVSDIPDLEKEREKKLDLENRKNAEIEKQKLEKIELEFKVKIGKEDRVFGSISVKQIKEELNNQGFKIDKKQIMLTNNIASLGYHDVSINLYADVNAKVKVHVVK